MGGKNVLEAELHKILQKLLLSRKDRKKYTEDAKDICNFIMKNMKKENELFNSLFKGLSLTGSYLDDLKIKKPNEFDYQVKLKLSSTIKPERISENPGCVCLRVDEPHQFVIDNYVQRHHVQTWMRDILKKMFRCSPKVKATHETYELTYESQGYSVAHTIKARNLKSETRSISFDFVPVFEFPATSWCFTEKLPICERTWFAVPLKKRGTINQKAFKVCAAHWEEQILENKVNLKNSLRFMKALRDATGMTQLASYMIKSAYLIEIDLQTNIFWQKSIGEITLHMIRQLIKYLADGKLPFYWDRNNNLFKYIDYSTRKTFWEKLENAEIVLKGIEYDRKRFLTFFKDI